MGLFESDEADEPPVVPSLDGPLAIATVVENWLRWRRGTRRSPGGSMGDAGTA
jgi:hypothetical protein